MNLKWNQAKKVILDFVSFGTPQTRFINLFLILFFLAIFPTNALTYSPFKCVFKNLILPLIFNGNCPITGFFADCECPACGLTRALSSLLHGDIYVAWNFNPLVFVLLPVMLIVMFISVRAWINFYRKKGRLF